MTYISDELLEHQRQINAMHDDRLDAMALGMYGRGIFYSRRSRWQRFWATVKGLFTKAARSLAGG